MKTIFNTLFFLLFVFTVNAQTVEGFLEIKGKVKADGKGISYVQMDIFEGSTKIDSKKTSSGGKFLLKLKFDKKLIVIFSKKGYVSKKIAFDTHLKEKQYIFPYPFNVELFEMVEGLDISALEQPVTKISYSEEEGDFTFDTQYASVMKGKIDKILKQLESLKSKKYDNKIAEADKMFKARKYDKAIDLYEEAIKINPYTDYPDEQIMLCESKIANSAKDEKEYNRFISRADNAFNAQSYSEAKSSYESALAIYPDKTYPKEKLAEIKDKIKQIEKEKLAKQAVEKAYQAFIKQADADFSKKSYDSAKKNYQLALDKKPNESYPKERISEIDKQLALIAENKAKEEQYQKAIQDGDKYFSSKDYVKAKSSYASAQSIKPKESYPKQKISEIESLLADAEKAKQLEAEYQALISKGDGAFQSKDYTASKQHYSDALTKKPNEQYPKDKIKEIDGLLASIAKEKEQNAQYQKHIQSGDNAFSKQKYTEAKSSYNSALALKPNESYPKEQLSKIEAKLSEIAANKANEEAYQAFIKQADADFSKKSYDSAKKNYQLALDKKPNESYPKERISEIDKQLALIAENKAKEEQYQKAIQDGDKYFSSKDYVKAKSSYASAQSIKPKESYPKQKISEIEGLLADAEKAKQLEAEYQALISKGDGAFQSKDYTASKQHYSDALSKKPNEQYPKDKIKEIDGLLASIAKEKEQNAQYQKHIQSGDNAFSKQKYTEAKSSYNSALALKPNESYPKEQLSKIEAKLSEIAANKANEEAYQAFIKQADADFSKKSYDSAKKNYQLALDKKPNESYPKERISEIDKQLALIAENKAKEEQYQKAIQDGDKYFSSKDYVKAKSSYASAQSIKPKESYPKQKISEIESLLADAEKAKQLESEYQALISKGDGAFQSKDYTASKQHYSDALTKKPNEQYPKDKIKEIDGLLASIAKEKEQNAQYQKHIQSGDNAFSKQKYTEAKSSYNSALALKPNESYPKEQLSKIEAKLSEIAANKANEEAYQAFIKQADADFSKKSYDSAKKNYQLALDKKPNESYPKERISEVDKLLKKQLVDKQYADFLKKGEELMLSKKYEDAKAEYQKASDLKPTEVIPQQKIKEIDQLIAKAEERKKMLAEYKTLVQQADDKLGQEKYIDAKTLYQKAISINRNAKYPKDKIKEIDALLSEMSEAKKQEQRKAAKEAQYKNLIAIGDKFFEKKNYSGAKQKYELASKIYEDRSYPKEKLSEIEKLLQAERVVIPKEIDFSNAEEKKKFISQMAEKYGEGVHEENYEDKGGKKVRRIIVVKNGIADEYREVKQPWGATYFFKNGKNVGRSLFFNETKKK